MDILQTDKGVEQQATRLRHTEPCFKETCPINCKMGTWGGWEACSTDCGAATGAGRCDRETRRCECNAGFAGDACERAVAKPCPEDAAGRRTRP